MKKLALAILAAAAVMLTAVGCSGGVTVEYTPDGSSSTYVFTTVQSDAPQE